MWAFTRLPLWATPRGPSRVSITWGWALRSPEPPVVEYRGVADTELAFQRRQVVLVEHRWHQPLTLVDVGGALVAGGDAGRLLATVLERVEGEEREPGRIEAGGVDTHHAAFLAKLIS